MGKPENDLHARTQSCRGVSFETNTRTSAPLTPRQQGHGSSRWPLSVSLMINGSSSFKVSPLTPKLQRTDSNHFCDIDLDLDLDLEDDGENKEGSNTIHEEETTVADDVEKQMPPPVPLPPQPTTTNRPPTGRKTAASQTRLSILLLDQGLFTVYKRLFALSLALNLVFLALAARGHFPYAKRNAALFSLGNILALTLCRSEAFLRAIFFLEVKLFAHSWVPISVKTATTSLMQSLGGIHSSCGISAVAWLIYALVLTLQNRDTASTEIVLVAIAILVCLCLSCMSAFPLVRHLHHNVFERTHRFAGWTALALLWAYVVLTTGYDPASKSYANLTWSRLLRLQAFWFTFATTFLIVLPWVTVRKVPVTVTSPSTHASLIKFSGGVKAGILGRVARSPLSEWHAFGIISDNKDSHMMLAGAVGDFTRGLIADPPTHLWVRSLHFAGLPYLVDLYERVVMVCTGSGIGVYMSFLLQPTRADVCMVWVTKGVEQNFGKEMKGMLTGFPEGKVVVHDTAVTGRPDVAAMAVEQARRWRADVVVVTSNPQGSRDVVRACKAAGFPAFAPIWDS